MLSKYSRCCSRVILGCQPNYRLNPKSQQPHKESTEITTDYRGANFGSFDGDPLNGYTPPMPIFDPPTFAESRLTLSSRSSIRLVKFSDPETVANQSSNRSRQIRQHFCQAKLQLIAHLRKSKGVCPLAIMYAECTLLL